MSIWLLDLDQKAFRSKDKPVGNGQKQIQLKPGNKPGSYYEASSKHNSRVEIKEQQKIFLNLQLSC